MKFSEWLTLEESSGKKHRCDHLGQLSAQMLKALARVHSFGYGQIAPDGDGYYDKQGTINIYVRPQGGGVEGWIKPERQKDVIDAALEYLRDMGYKTGKIERNTYKDFADRQAKQFQRLRFEMPDEDPELPNRVKHWAMESGYGNPEAIRVYRIPVDLGE